MRHHMIKLDVIKYTLYIALTNVIGCCKRYDVVDAISLFWAFWLLPTVSARDSIIKPESFSSSADNGTGVDTKGDDQNDHVITCLSHL